MRWREWDFLKERAGSYSYSKLQSHALGGVVGAIKLQSQPHTLVRNLGVNLGRPGSVASVPDQILHMCLDIVSRQKGVIELCRLETKVSI